MAKIGRILLLITLAVLIVKVTAAEGFVLLSVTQLLSELSPSEIARTSAYDVVIAYSLSAVVVAAISGLLLFRVAIGKSSRIILAGLVVVGGLLYGTHLAFLFLIGISNQVLNEFAQRLAWESEMGLVILVGLGVLVLWDTRHPQGRSRAGS